MLSFDWDSERPKPNLAKHGVSFEGAKDAFRDPFGLKIIRRALGLTPQRFSARYRIPLGTLRDWEQGRSEPDQPARADLRVIAAESVVTAQALGRPAG